MLYMFDWRAGANPRYVRLDHRHYVRRWQARRFDSHAFSPRIESSTAHAMCVSATTFRRSAVLAGLRSTFWTIA
jgi:hypothetical protein